MTSIVAPDRSRSGPSPDVSRALRHAEMGLTREQRARQELAGAAGHLRDALEAMAALRSHLRGMAETTIAASIERDLGMRALLAEDYDDQLLALPGLVSRRYPAAVVLIGPKASPLRVPLPTGGDYMVAPFSLGSADAPFGLSTTKKAFAVDSEVSAAMAGLEAAFAKVDRATVIFVQNRQFLTERMTDPAAL